MPRQQPLADRIARLSPAQQSIVEKLIDKLESNASNHALTLDEALDEIEREHPELLRLLAQ